MYAIINNKIEWVESKYFYHSLKEAVEAWKKQNTKTPWTKPLGYLEQCQYQSGVKRLKHYLTTRIGVNSLRENM